MVVCPVPGVPCQRAALGAGAPEGAARSAEPASRAVRRFISLFPALLTPPAPSEQPHFPQNQHNARRLFSSLPRLCGLGGLCARHSSSRLPSGRNKMPPPELESMAGVRLRKTLAVSLVFRFAGQERVAFSGAFQMFPNLTVARKRDPPGGLFKGRDALLRVRGGKGHGTMRCGHAISQPALEHLVQNQVTCFLASLRAGGNCFQSLENGRKIFPIIGKNRFAAGGVRRALTGGRGAGITPA